MYSTCNFQFAMSSNLLSLANAIINGIPRNSKPAEQLKNKLLIPRNSQEFQASQVLAYCILYVGNIGNS